jgi:hypothetical protein
VWNEIQALQIEVEEEIVERLFQRRRTDRKGSMEC